MEQFLDLAGNTLGYDGFSPPLVTLSYKEDDYYPAWQRRLKINQAVEKVSAIIDANEKRTAHQVSGSPIF